ncbi:MAG: MbnP family protein [Saprospiraceae bacterium]
MKLESSKPAIFFLIMLAFIFTQCHKEEGTTTLETPDSLGIKGDLNLSFAPRFGDQAFEPVKSYTYTGKQKVMFSKVDFYITGIKLEGNKPYESDMAGLIDLTGDADKRLISMIDIPSGNYTGITFTFGVTPILNKKSPKDFTSNNPLSFASNYWADWDSYIFSVVQGLFDENGQGNFNAGFSILTGTDDCSEKVEINRLLL